MQCDHPLEKERFGAGDILKGLARLGTGKKPMK